MLFYYIKEILTTLLPLRIILPSRRFVSSLVSSTSSSTRFMYSSYPNSLPSICLPSFKRRSNFWFTAFSRTSNGKDMAEGKENTLFKTIPYRLGERVRSYWGKPPICRLGSPNSAHDWTTLASIHESPKPGEFHSTGYV